MHASECHIDTQRRLCSLRLAAEKLRPLFAFTMTASITLASGPSAPKSNQHLSSAELVLLRRCTRLGVRARARAKYLPVPTLHTTSLPQPSCHSACVHKSTPHRLFHPYFRMPCSRPPRRTLNTSPDLFTPHKHHRAPTGRS